MEAYAKKVKAGKLVEGYLQADHPVRVDILPLGAYGDDVLDLLTGQREPPGQLLGRDVYVDILSQPRERDADRRHQTDSRYRRSFW